jgi:nucleoside-diphosphate-sugar epimerase
MKIIKITITGAMDIIGKALVQKLSKKKLKLFSLTDIKSGKTINGIRTQKK